MIGRSRSTVFEPSVGTVKREVKSIGQSVVRVLGRVLTVEVGGTETDHRRRTKQTPVE